MKFWGINYDVGTKTVTGGLTRESFLAEDVKTEMDVIKNTLHCIAGTIIRRPGGYAVSY